MAQTCNKSSWQIVLASFLAISGIIVDSCKDTTLAQNIITPDQTLGNENSVVVGDGVDDLIKGGAQRGTNLFHSFLEFNVGQAGGVLFEISDTNIQNVVTRVTGTSISNIQGYLGTSLSNGTNDFSNANLFLINPNGIIFGPNASISIGGSFVASTASGIQFADGTVFSANNTQIVPLLTVTAPIGLQFGNNIGNISVQGTYIPLKPGRTLALVGGNVNLDSDQDLGLSSFLEVPGGQVAIGGISEPGTVGLNLEANNLPLIFPDDVKLADVSFKNLSAIDVSDVGGGHIQVQGRQIFLTGGSILTAATLGSQDGRGIFIQGEQLKLQDGSLITTFTQGAGKGGDLTVKASDSVQIRGFTFIDRNQIQPSGLFADTFRQGKAGNLTVETKNLIVEDGGIISATSRSQGGLGSNLTVNADFIKISGTNNINGDPSGLFAVTFSQNQAGNLTVETKNLIVENGGVISSTSREQGGRGGNLTVTADFIKLSGTNNINGEPSGLFTQTLSTGDAGLLTINTQQLIVQNGAQVTAGTGNNSRGNGGTLTVSATDFIELSGTNANGQTSSGLFARSRGTGNAGSLNIVTNQLTVRDNAIVTVENLGSGNAGNLDIQARSVRLNNRGKITAATTSGQGGNISLRNLDLLLLRGNSQITTNADTSRVGAEVAGGNININSKLIVATPGANSDITANAFRGRGGNINITTEGLFGIQPRDALTPSNDITASSQLGINGTIQINTPDVEPSKRIVALSADVFDVAQTIAQACSGDDSQGLSSLIVTGRGGLPPLPDEPLSSDIVWSDTRLTAVTRQPRSSKITTAKLTSAPNTLEIVPATGWVFNKQGEVKLIAHVSNLASYGLETNHTSCHANKN